MADIGANILAQFLTDDDKRELRSFIRNEWKPNTALVMDDFALAQDIVQDTGGETQVIYRAWDRDDHRWHEIQDAEAIWNRHRPYMRQGIAVQIWNEPFGYTDLRRIGEVTKALAIHAGREFDVTARSGIAVPHWAVGHPDTARIDAGEYDEGLKAISRSQHAVLLCGHEYAIASMKDETPFRIGRIEALLKRAARIGAPINARNVVITESGRDVGGGEEDGWRMVFMPSEYLHFILAGMPIYERIGVRAILPFCIGAGAVSEKSGLPQWRNFDCWREWVLLRGFAQYCREHLEMIDLGAMREAVVTSAYENGGSSIRPFAGNTTTLLGSLNVGDPILVSERSTPAGAYQWYKVQKGSIVGYVAKTGVFDFTLKSEPQPPAPKVGLTQAQKDEMIGLLSSIEEQCAQLRLVIASVETVPT